MGTANGYTITKVEMRGGQTTSGYGAQGGTTNYTNFVIFEQATVNSAIKGSATIIPW